MGVYFEYSFCFFNALLLGYLVYHILRYRKLYYSKDIVFFGLLSIILVYIFSYFFAVDKGMNIYGVIKVLMPFLFYLVLLQIDIEKTKLEKIIVISGFIIAFLSICGLYIKSIADMIIQNNRFGGFLGYPNAYALYMLVVFILLQQPNYYNKYLKVLFNSILLVSVMLTYSRSVVILSIFVLVYIFIIANSKVRKEILVSLFMTALLYFIIINTSILHGDSIRMTQITTQATEVQARLLYYSDAINIVKNNIWGLGYDGYYYIQGAYQTGIYKVKLVHNSVLQVALEIGIIGIVLYGIMFCSILIRRAKNLKHENLDYLDLAFFIIVIHSLFDFDLSFGVLVNILIVIIYMRTRGLKLEIRVWRRTAILGFMVLIVVNLLLGVSAWAVHMGEYDLAFKIYKYNTEAYVSKAYYYMKNKDYDDAKKYIYYAKNLNDSNIEILKIEREIDIFEGNFKKALKNQENIVELDRINILEVEKYSDLLLEIITNEVYNSRERKNYKKKIENIRNYIYETAANISELAYNQKRVPIFLMTKKLLENEKEALKY